MAGAEFSQEVEAIYRRESGRCLATLIRVVGDVELAEDAVAEAFVRAAKRWPGQGIPANPGGWITTTARNIAIDHLRRESTRTARQAEAIRLHRQSTADPVPEFNNEGDVAVVADDQLRLMFLCCHPCLRPDAQVALILRLLGGLSTSEIARAFLVSEKTLAQRLVRAKRKIRDNHIAYRIPEKDQLPHRLEPVLTAIYLVFNEGHTASTGTELVRPTLLAEGLRLGRLLHQLLPDESEARGLLALLLLAEARRPARLDLNGRAIPLSEQDRTRWDRNLIDEGHRLVRDCLRLERPGPFQIQAAIGAVHTDAMDSEETDWGQIVSLYELLLTFQDDDLVRLNLAIAKGKTEGPEIALQIVDQLDLPDYPLFHATRGSLLRRLGQESEASDAYAEAASRTQNEVERSHFQDLA